ncbi:hypothetical protein BJ980_002468 [Nocardioides daedukensis]|uniref:Enoyl-CoA hydratase/isomerase family protein n=1 Tax=Nocardioides daedukensis TaxID=634462 RepID=A0A7Y9S086_9ACTN|nr:enoyl-CoA hydratase/isomerase family protein [Nocardioides daedukensis]NYG59545.1 hypothetical protein [Nocardioides daedukensis]
MPTAPSAPAEHDDVVPPLELIVVRPGESISRDHLRITALVLDSATSRSDLDDAALAEADLVIAPADSPSAQCREVVGVDDIDESIELLARSVAEHPCAVWSLARLLPITESLDVREGLLVESATFSTLLAGSEFRAWLDARGAPRAAGDTARLGLQRSQDELIVTLDRPDRRNAYDARMRDALLEALEVAQLDPSLRVTLRGAGPSFCAGGDLDEFGSAQDLAAAHHLRVTCSPGARIHSLRDRVTAYIHGHAVGSGIEIAAFAGTVRATRDARFGLPEIAMGLIPGAGGTVSLSRRIGRHRMLWWALSGRTLDATTAHRWGLVDELLD